MLPISEQKFAACHWLATGAPPYTALPLPLLYMSPRSTKPPGKEPQCTSGKCVLCRAPTSSESLIKTHDSVSYSSQDSKCPVNWFTIYFPSQLQLRAWSKWPFVNYFENTMFSHTLAPLICTGTGTSWLNCYFYSVNYSSHLSFQCLSYSATVVCRNIGWMWSQFRFLFPWFCKHCIPQLEYLRHFFLPFWLMWLAFWLVCVALLDRIHISMDYLVGLL